MSELASRIPHDSKSKLPTAIINCITPRACKSDFDRESTRVRRIIGDLTLVMIARTAWPGSRTLVVGVATGEESHVIYG